MTSKKIRIVCISDTHNAAPGEGFTLPKGDILIHAGDLTNQSTPSELTKALTWLSAADFPTKLIIAGNHDSSLSPSLFTPYPSLTYLSHTSLTLPLSLTVPSRFPPSETTPPPSLSIFASPRSPLYNPSSRFTAFQYPPASGADVWHEIPEGLDVLITHTPPAGLCDASAHWVEGGCRALRAEIERKRPRVVVCGHCHEGRGAVVVEWGGETGEEVVRKWEDPAEGEGRGRKMSVIRVEKGGKDGEGEGEGRQRRGRTTVVVNASICAESYSRGGEGKERAKGRGKRWNKPIVVDLEI